MSDPDPPIVDVHCHVHGADFDADRRDVLAEATEAGVVAVLAMGEGAEDNQRLLDLCADQQRDPGVARIVPCLGLHPDRAGDEPVDPVVAQIRAHRDALGAIGEVGLDYWVAKEDHERELQRRAFSTLIALALELDLPLSVHARSAGHHALALLAELGAKRVCMHAFDGAAKHAVRAVEEHGFSFSVPPSVVRSPQKQKLVERLPLTALMLETDAPVLGPDREQRNVPRNVRVAARYIAEAKGVSEHEVLVATAETTRRLFGDLVGYASLG